MRKFVSLICLAALVACNSEPKEEAPVVLDSAQIAVNVAREDSNMVFSTENVEWLKKALPQKETLSKDMELEEFWNQDSLEYVNFSPEDNFYTNYQSVLRWSPDSSWVLDFGSYGNIPVKDKNGNIKLEGGEPDSEVAIMIPRTNQRARLMFVGPSSQIIDGRWLSNDEAVVLGTFAHETDKRDTLLWMINMKERFFRLYNLNNKR